MMIINKTMPKDSITVRSIQTDKFKTGALAVLVRTPDKKYSSPYSLILCELLRNATKKYPTKASIARRLDELYAASVGIKAMREGNWRVFAFSAEILDEKYTTDQTDILGGMGEMLSQFMLSPFLDEEGLFPEKTFEQEKKRVATYLRSIINNPARYASMRLSDMIYRDDSEHLDLEGLIEAVEKCDRASLVEFYKENVTSYPIEIFYMGTLSHEDIEKRMLEYFGEHRASSEKEAEKEMIKNRPLFSFEERESKIKEESMPVNQGRLALAYRTGICPDSDDFYAAVLMNEILGGGASSKLFMNVREKMSLCYSCSSTYEMDMGLIRISSGIDPKNREIAENAIKAEFENIKNGVVSEYEFVSAQKAIENSYREIYDNPFDIFAFYSARESLGVRCTIDECRERFKKVNIDDVVRVAQGSKLDSVYFLNGTSFEGAEDDDEEEECDE